MAEGTAGAKPGRLSILAYLGLGCGVRGAPCVPETCQRGLLVGPDKPDINGRLWRGQRRAKCERYVGIKILSFIKLK